MKHATRELTGALLDQAVALAEGLETEKQGLYTYARPKGGVYWDRFEPSTNWAQGGPLMGRVCEAVVATDLDEWQAQHREERVSAVGVSMLEAAMRTYVVARFGDVVELP